MRRRQFTQLIAGLSAAAGLPAVAGVGNPSWAQQFKSALADRPWLLGYRTVQQPRFAADAEVSGSWPKALTGTFYRNGPAQHEIGDYRYRHWFAGDGMLQAYRVGADGVNHQAALIETYKVQAERRAGRALYPGFASTPPDPAPVTSPDAVNVANISVLHHHGKLLALWEAGSPWEMDPEDLSTRGAYAFSPEMRGVPFSAHPRIEPDGTLWNFGYLSSAKLLVLWHVDKNGKLVKAGKVKADPISMVHDFVVTRRHLVLMVPPLHYSPDGAASSFLDAHKWRPDDPTRLLVVDKNNFDNHFWVELPSQWVFHYGNGWEDDNGVIHFDAARAGDPMAMIDSFREVMRGNLTPSGGSHHHEYRIDTRTRKVAEAPMFGMNLETEFPSVDPRVSGQRNRRLTMMSSNTLTPPVHGHLNEVSHFDYDSGARAVYRYPDTEIPEEHIYVADPSRAAETDGWVIGTAFDWKTDQTLLNVFDARALADGPLATARLPYGLPLGLHGRFVHG